MQMQLNRNSMEVLTAVLHHCYKDEFELKAMALFMRTHIQRIIPKVAKLHKRLCNSKALRSDNTKPKTEISVTWSETETIVIYYACIWFTQDFPATEISSNAELFFLTPINELQ